MENLHFLSKISNLLISEIDTKELADGIKQLLQQIVPVKRLQIYVFDNVTNTMRDSSNNWSVIPGESEIYKIYEKILTNGHFWCITVSGWKMTISHKI